MPQPVSPVPAGRFSDNEREAVYRAIHTRRDVRGQFRPDPISEEVLYRLLLAAHHAPSVGLMQPWNFIVIEDASAKSRIREAFRRANETAAALIAAAVLSRLVTPRLGVKRR